MHRLTEIMHRLADAVQRYAEHSGGLGLAAVAFIDSSFLTLPQVADVLVVVFSMRAPHLWLYFAAMTTAGSLAGSFVLYRLGGSGSRSVLRRVHERHVERAMRWYARYGALTLIVPATLPPPMPFKFFVLMAGVAGVKAVQFLWAVALGRGLRYGVEAWLARAYGERTIQFIQQETLPVLVPLLAAGGLALLAWWLWRRSRAAAIDAVGRGPQPSPADVE